MRRLTVLTIALGACSGVNHRPQLDPVAAGEFFVGARGEIALRAHDPDGDELTYTFHCPTIPNLHYSTRAKLLPFADQAIFSWEPIGDDVGEHEIDFTVSDGFDFAVESTPAMVRASGAIQPRFIRPANSGEVLDLGASPDIELQILVDDLDSEDVEITQDPPIEYSKLTRDPQKPFEARFYWAPRDWQIDQQQDWLLTLVADDGEHVTKKLFTISLVREEQGTP